MLQLDVETGLELIAKAMEQERDERIFQQWTAQLSAMAFTGVYVSFADYKDRVTGANIDRRSTAEILRDLEDVERELQEGGAADGTRDL